MDTPIFIMFMGTVGAGIGWITNVVAIRLLFRPYRRYTVPLLGWDVQGVIPKRRKDIAVTLGRVISTELITGEDVAQSLGQDEIKEKIARKVQVYVQERILDRLPVLIPQAIQLALADYAGKTLYQEVVNFLDNPQKILKDQELDDIRAEIQKIVEEKVLTLDMSKLEEITYTLARKELKHIELLGGILGFLIGLIQGVITLAVRP